MPNSPGRKIVAQKEENAAIWPAEDEPLVQLEFDGGNGQNCRENKEEMGANAENGLGPNKKSNGLAKLSASFSGSSRRKAEKKKQKGNQLEFQSASFGEMVSNPKLAKIQYLILASIRRLLGLAFVDGGHTDKHYFGCIGPSQFLGFPGHHRRPDERATQIGEWNNGH